MTDDGTISRIEAALAEGTFDFGQLCCEKGEWSGSPDEPPVCCGRPLSCADDIRTLLDRLRDAEESAEWHRRRANLLQHWQVRMREPERTIVCDILANGTTLPDPDGKRYGSAALENTDAR